MEDNFNENDQLQNLQLKPIITNDSNEIKFYQQIAEQEQIIKVLNKKASPIKNLRILKQILENKFGIPVKVPPALPQLFLDQVQQFARDNNDKTIEESLIICRPDQEKPDIQKFQNSQDEQTIQQLNNEISEYQERRQRYTNNRNASLEHSPEQVGLDYQDDNLESYQNINDPRQQQFHQNAQNETHTEDEFREQQLRIFQKQVQQTELEQMQVVISEKITALEQNMEHEQSKQQISETELNALAAELEIKKRESIELENQIQIITNQCQTIINETKQFQVEKGRINEQIDSITKVTSQVLSEFEKEKSIIIEQQVQVSQQLLILKQIKDQKSDDNQKIMKEHEKKQLEQEIAKASNKNAKNYLQKQQQKENSIKVKGNDQNSMRQSEQEKQKIKLKEQLNYLEVEQSMKKQSDGLKGKYSVKSNLIAEIGQFDIVNNKQATQMTKYLIIAVVSFVLRYFIVKMTS